LIGIGAAYVLMWGLAGPVIFLVIGAVLLLAKPVAQKGFIRVSLQSTVSSPRRSIPWFKIKILGVIFVLVGLVFLLSGKSGLARQNEFHNQLANLDPMQVTDVQIANTLITNRDDIYKITNALRHSEWFLSNHGGWTTLVPVKIGLKSQPDFNCNVACYLKKEGAIVFRGNDSTDVMEFSSELSNALKTAGFTLPILEEDRVRYH
jgi:multisubunit Na+/H+ antiporter MnhG subunit